MGEFFEACTQSPINLALSVMLLLTMVYWIVVILGGLGIDSLDIDLDADGDADVDLLHAGIGAGIMRFFHVGTVPILVTASFFIILLWLTGIVLYPWIGKWGQIVQILMLIPMAVVVLVLTRFVTLPLKILFEKMQAQEEAEQDLDLIGQRCMVVSLTADARHGQVEVARDGAPLRLNVITPDEKITLNKGDEAVIIAHHPRTGTYTIRGF